MASTQQRTSLIKLDHLAEKSEYASISNLSTKAASAPAAGKGLAESADKADAEAEWPDDAESSVSEEPGTKVEPLKASDADSVDWEDGDEVVAPEKVADSTEWPE